MKNAVKMSWGITNNDTEEIFRHRDCGKYSPGLGNFYVALMFSRLLHAGCAACISPSETAVLWGSLVWDSL